MPLKLKKFGLIVLVFSLLILLQPRIAYAAGITAISDTMSRLQVSQNSSHAIKFTTDDAIQTTGDTITITFPSDFNFTSKTIGTVTFTHGATTGLENTETLAAAPSGTEWGAVFSGTQNRIFTLTAPTDGIGAAAVAISDKLIITYSSANSVNGSSNTTYVGTIAVAGSATESGSFAVVLLTTDRVTMTATVDPSITFSISATSSNFGILSTGSVTTSSPNIDLVVGTNAQSGYTISVYDTGNGANPGLYNATASSIIGSATAAYADTATLSIGVEGYGIQGSSTTATIDTRYDQTGNAVGGLEITSQTLATYSSGLSANHTITVTHKAAIGTWTKAGSYNDTITYIATGNF